MWPAILLVISLACPDAPGWPVGRAGRPCVGRGRRTGTEPAPVRQSVGGFSRTSHLLPCSKATQPQNSYPELLFQQSLGEDIGQGSHYPEPSLSSVTILFNQETRWERGAMSLPCCIPGDACISNGQKCGKNMQSAEAAALLILQ